MSATMGELPFVFPLVQPKGPYERDALDIVMTKGLALWPKLDRQSAQTALSTDFSAGDTGRAITLLQFWLDATHGYISRPQPLPLRGACNFNGISCYADSLLMAMFSRMNNFEPLLYQQQFDEYPTEVFATWLRLFVNLLRNGELLTSDIVRGLLEAAKKAGWYDVDHQQDTAEFFGFITEKLRMPLLNLKVNIAHGGREDAEDDHKSVLEQLLYLPVPGGSNDPPLPLEACLEEYFSDTVSVSRNLDPIQGPSQSAGPSKPAKRSRSYSIVSTTTPSLPGRRSMANLEKGDELPTYTALYGTESPALDVKRSLWTPENEMNLPAWMFLQLMPFYAENQDSTVNNLEAQQVAQHFRKARPILGLCLKRYSWDLNGEAIRNSRRIVVPENIYLPSFVADDSDRDQVFGNFKLELESAIFHRGKDIHSGHYVAVVGETPKPNRRSTWMGSQPTSPELSGLESGTRQWLLFDDMAPVGEKVKPQSFSDVFDNECPYLLFYRMVALDEPPPEPLTKPANSKPKKKKNFFRRTHKDDHDYAEYYRQEKCTLQ